MNKNVTNLCKRFIKEVLEKEDWFCQLVMSPGYTEPVDNGKLTRNFIASPCHHMLY